MCRWLVDNENDICDAVRGTTLGLPFDVDYTELKQKALDGEVDWVPPVFTYKDGELAGQSHEPKYLPEAFTTCSRVL